MRKRGKRKDIIYNKYSLLIIFILILILLGIFILIFFIRQIQFAAGDIPKWSVNEFTCTTGASYSNPYTQVTVTESFTGPGGISKTIKGFWDGNDGSGKAIFKIRFTPTVEGAWSYNIASSDSGLTCVGGRTGSLNIIPASAGSKGFLRFDPASPRHFVFDSGDHFFMVGQTYYEIIRNARAGNTWRTAIDNTKSKGINKVRMLIFPWNGVTNTNYPASSPFGADHNTLNLVHWQKFDEIIQYLASKDMTAEIILFPDEPSAYGTLTQDQRYARYALARYAAYPNVVWAVTNEWEYCCFEAVNGVCPSSLTASSSCVNYWENMGNLLRSEDPWSREVNKLRLLSIHQRTRIDFEWFNSNWPSHAVIQYGVRNRLYTYGDQWGNAGILYNLNSGRNPSQIPAVNDEYGYIGEFGSIGGSDDRKDHRNVIWGIYTAGGYGTFGDLRTFSGAWPILSADWHDALEYDDTKRLIDFFTTRNIQYWRMTNKNSLITSGSRVYMLGENSIAYILYAANGGSFTINLPSLASGQYTVKKYNPRDGTETTLTSFSGGSKSYSFDSNDWVLLIRAPTCTDNDGDQYGIGDTSACPHPQIDCNDNNASINPGATEICGNSVDENCDGIIEFCSSLCIDNDGDRYNQSAAGCGVVDCNDTNINVNPGAAEICGNLIDDNCVNGIDEGCGGGNCLTTDPNLKLYLSFDSSSNPGTDNSGKGHDGVLTNGAAWTLSGRFGGAVDFDGINDYVNVLDHNDFDFGTKNFTLLAWIKDKNRIIDSNHHQPIIVKSDYVKGQWGFDLQSGNVTRFHKDTTSYAATYPALNDDVWHHVAVKKQGSSLTLYVDNQQVNSFTGVTTNLNNAKNLSIGARIPLSADRKFNGTIDEVLIFDRALTNTEISAIYNNQLCGGGAVCGNGIVETGEGCDDANTLSGDGCSSSCMIEPGYSCTGQPSTCTRLCTDNDGDGYGDGCAFGADCDDANVNVHATISCNYNGASCGNYQLCVASCPVPPVEICGNTVDEDCNGVPDACSVVCIDNDGDRYNQSAAGCGVADCDDTRINVHPGAAEICGNLIDDNCVNGIDEGCGGGSCLTSDVALVLYTPFNNSNANDFSGKGHNGIVSGAAWTSAGKYGGAYNFDGVNDFINFTDNNDFHFGTGDFTFVAWIKNKNAIIDTNHHQPILVKSTFATGQWGFDLTSGQKLRLHKDTTNYVANESISLNDNQWHHVAVKKQGDILTLYIDGQIAKSFTGVAAMDLTNTINLYIGARVPLSAQRQFNGIIDEVMMFNRALSNTEITSIYNNQLCT